MGFGFGIAPKLRKLHSRNKGILRRFFRPRLILKGERENIAAIFSEPHDMSVGDRIVLYGLIRGLKPRTYLEIGVRWGGSARLVATAMAANGFGRAVGLDPNLGEFRPTPAELNGHYVTLEGYSPEDTGKAAQMVGGRLDFVFIDAVHTYSAVKADLAGVVPFLSDGGYILFHDAYHQGINGAVDEFLTGNEAFVDLGIVSRNAAPAEPVSYMGMRLIRKGHESFEVRLKELHQLAGQDTPFLSRDVWDYDPYAVRMGNPLGRKKT